MSGNNQKPVLIETGRRLYERSLVAASEGNLSIRDNAGRIFTTATGTCLGKLQDSDIVILDACGKPLPEQKKPSSEYRLHLAVYKNRPDINACCHAHPPHATAYAVTNTPFPPPFLPEAVLMVGPIASIDYATPGTDRLAENLEKHLAGHNAFILKNHGALTLGKNMDEAFRRMEIVENLARIAYIASALGKIDLLSKDEIHRLEKIRESLKSDGFADD